MAIPTLKYTTDYGFNLQVADRINRLITEGSGGSGGSPTVQTLSDAIELAELEGISVGDTVTTNEYHSGTGLGGNKYQLVDGQGSRPTEDGGSVIHVGGGDLYLKGLFLSGYIITSQFGLISDYSFNTHTGTDNTIQTTFLFIHAANSNMKIMADGLYLTDTINLTPLDDANYPVSAGRVTVEGSIAGVATGDIENATVGFAHVNGSTSPLINIRGVFDPVVTAQTGRAVCFDKIAIIGGDSTTDVVNIEDTTANVSITDCAIRIRNPAGNGLTEKTAWGLYKRNVLIRGDADPTNRAFDTVWTGVGHKRVSGVSIGQNNMDVSINLNIVKCGYGRRLGRGVSVNGTFGPIIVIGGQCSNNQHEGEWLDGGIVSYTSQSQQFEGNGKSGNRIDSDGAGDLPRNIKYSECYYTNNGRIEDGSNESFNINIVDAVGVTIDNPIFNECDNGIVVDCTAGAKNIEITKPTFRTVSTYGSSSGTGIKIIGDGASLGLGLCQYSGEIFNQNFNTNIEDNANISGASKVGGRITISNNLSTPNITKGGETQSTFGVVNFNNSTPTTITNILGGETYQELIITFSNRNTTIADNANIFLKSGVNYNPPARQNAIRLFRNDGIWTEI